MAADSAGQNLGEATVDFETDHTVIGAVHAGLGLLDVTSAVTGTKAGFRDLAKFTRVVGKSGTTRLWRAVEPEELADVVKYGDYNIHPNSTFKRFAFDEGSLDNFIKANPGRDYTKTFIDVPTENLGQMYRHADPGGVGKAIGIDVYENPQFYDWFNKVEVLSK
jgi:filamentous hemagglutinin